MENFLISILSTCFMNCLASRDVIIEKLKEMTLNTIPVEAVDEFTNDEQLVVRCNGCNVTFKLNNHGYIHGINVVDRHNDKKAA